MRTLTRRESVAGVMSTTIFEYLFQRAGNRRRSKSLRPFSDHNPRDGQVIAAQAAQTAH